ncbi:MAG: hypothetical protein ACRDUA_22380, partial [Micromonosporaceae bacterium]
EHADALYALGTLDGARLTQRYHDRQGRPRQVSVPQVMEDPQGFWESGWANYSDAATSFTYDELHRPRVTTLPDGQTTETTYDGWDHEAIDQKRHKRRFDHDALGRLVRVREYTGAGPWADYALTTYAYDVANQLTSVTDALGNVITVQNDPLGRKTQLADPDMGTWTYEYDPIGTLKAQTDAAGQRTDLFYDRLGRPVRTWHPVSWTQETLTAGINCPTVYDLMELRAAVDTNRAAAGLTTPAPGTWTDAAIVAGTGVRVRAVHFTELRDRIQDLWTAAGMGSVPPFSGGTISAGTRVLKASDLADLRTWLGQHEGHANAVDKRARVVQQYDAYDPPNGQYGRGRRTGMWDGCGRQTFTYDPAGRQTKEERTLDGHVYALRWTYDALGRVHQMTYPDN